MKGHQAIKVNTVFGDEFEVAKDDKILNDFKYLTTFNVPICKDTNLDKWFDKRVL